MPLKWIAAELHMGTWTHLNRLLHAPEMTLSLGLPPDVATLSRLR